MTVDFSLAGSIEESYCEADVIRAHARVQLAGRAQRDASNDVQRRFAYVEMARALRQLYKAQPNKFQLTGGSITTALAAMTRLGMLDLDTQHDQWPAHADYGVTHVMLVAFSELGEECLDLALFNAARDAVRDKQAENPTGIPAYKLQTTDGWLITPDEITAALGAYRTALGDGAEQPRLFWWPFWIAFLERASKYIGVRVG